MAGLQTIITLVDQMSDKLDRIANVGVESLDKIEGMAKKVDEGFDEAGKSTKNTTSAISDLDSMMATLGVTKVLYEIEQGFVKAASASIQFESAITGVYKTVDGTTQQLAGISAEIKRLAGTELPSTTTQIAAVAESAGQLGIKTEAITAFTHVIIDLGNATNLTGEVGAATLAKFANITKMPQDKYENLGSTIVDLGNNFATTEADIAAMSLRLGSALSLAGMAPAQIMGIAASLSSMGIEADAGGSAFSKLITDMQIAVETGSDRLTEFSNVAGLSAAGFKTAFEEDAAGALYSFIAGLNDSERIGKTATVILDDMGITEVRMSNAIRSLAGNSDVLNRALETSATAWEENTALANEAEKRYGTLESRITIMGNAATNLSVAFGDKLTPVVGEFVDLGADLLNGAAGIIEKYPSVTAAVTGVSVAFTVATGALTVYTVGAKVAEVATKAFNTAMKENPVGLLITGVAALTAGVVAFAKIIDANNPYDEWTASTRKQYDALQELNREYDETAAQWGETSYLALDLRGKIDEQTASFERSKTTLKEFIAECDKANTEYAQFVATQKDTEAATELEAHHLGTLSSRLVTLAEKQNRTTVENEEFLTVISALNSSLPGLNLQYEQLADSSSNAVDAVRLMINAQIDLKKQTEQREALIERYEQRTGQEERRAKILSLQADAEENLAAKVQARIRREQEAQANGTKPQGAWDWLTPIIDGTSAAASEVRKLDKELEQLDAEITENAASITNLENALAGVTPRAENAFISYSDAVSKATGSIQGDLDDLIKSYSLAYDESLKSIQGSIGLFDELDKKSDITVSQMSSRLGKQAKYLEEYADNIEKARQMGLDDSLLRQLSDGSQESADYLNKIVDGGASSVGKINQQYEKVAAAQAELAQQMTETQMGFETQMDAIEKKLLDSVASMNMEKDAADAASKTMKAYVAAIESYTPEVIAAGGAAAKALADALAKIGFGKAPEPDSKNAIGTSYAEEGISLVGENGPELVRLNGGEQILNADTTQKLLDAASKPTLIPAPLIVPPPVNNSATAPTGGTSHKEITINFAGSGTVKASKEMGKDEVLDIMVTHLRPVLVGMIEQEIFEEGDGSYGDY
ncbi:MAG: phage tail tape measure protein [Oscillospiraceae bacterium]|jgi:TP901 family phage tail tape measure protein|nr:phage tail tape measure protein [Oscillospiraceae bacterium]